MRVALRRLLSDLRRLVLYQGELGVGWYEFALPSLSFRKGKPQPAPPSAPAPEAEIRHLCPVQGPAPRQSLAELRRELADCHRCAGVSGPPVFGVGGAGAELMVVADRPTAAELAEKSVFIGESRLLFEKMMLAIGLAPERIFLCHFEKCGGGAAGDRKWCLDFLTRQIGAVQPRAILVFGVAPAQAMLASELPLFRLRGKVHQFCGVPLVATYSPGFLLEHTELKKMAWQDLQLIQLRLEHLRRREREESVPFLEP